MSIYQFHQHSNHSGKEKEVEIFERRIDAVLKYLFDEFNAADDVAAFNGKIVIFSELSMIRALLWDFKDTLIKNRVELERRILLRSIQDPRISIDGIYRYISLATPSGDEFLPSLYLSAEKNQSLFQELENLRNSAQQLIDDPDLLKDHLSWYA
jgi:hypothetical protein